jgi:drug/metabolite transporter (DMT)-like permease
MKAKISAVSVLAAIGAIIIWGSSFILTKNLLNEGGPFIINAIRLVVGLIVLLPLALRQGFKISLLRNANIVLMGLGMAVAFTFQNFGLQITSASSTALIQGGMPAMVAIIAFGFMGEKATPAKIIGIILSVSGIILVTNNSSSSQYDSVAGNLLVIVSVIAWTFYTLQGKRVAGLATSLVITTAVFIVTLLMLLPFTAWEITTQELPHFSTTSLLILVYLGTCASAIAFFLWNFTLSHMEATVAGAFANLEPVVGMGFAILLGEQAFLMQMAGGAMAILGVWLCTL